MPKAKKSFGKLRNILFHVWPLLVIVGVWFVFASPYFFSHKIPYPSRFQVSFFTPWNEYSEYAIPTKNNALSDVVNEIYPWKHFTIEELKKGKLPLWNPYSFSGTPHLANYQTAVFSPLNFLFFLLPFIDAWSLMILLQPLLAGLFMYLFSRTLKISQVGSAITSIAFMFCGFITVWMAYGTLSLAVAFLPLALFSIEKVFTTKQKRYLFLLIVSICASFFSGHFQMSLYVFCYSLAFLFFRGFQTRNKKAFLFSLAAVGTGIAISLVQILPTLLLYKQSVRSELFFNNEGIPWHYLVTLFAPDFFGNPVTRNDWVGHYGEWASFIGIIPFMLALGAIFTQKKKGIVIFFLCSGLIFLLLSLDTPLQKFLAFLQIPVFSTSIPSRIIVLFSFSLVVLAGFGFDAVMDSLGKKSYKEFIPPFIAKVIILIVIWGSVLFLNLLPADKALLADRNLILPTLLFAIVIAAIMLTLIIKRQGNLIFLAILILFLTSFDSLRFAMKWMPFEERHYIYPAMPVITEMQKQIGFGRVYGDLGAYIDTYYHLPTINGYDPLYSKRYGEFLESAKTGQFAPAIRSVADLNERGKYTQRVIDLLGVTLIYQPISHTNQPWAFPVWEHPENFPTAYRDERIAVFKNTTALPRVKLFYNYEVIQDPKKLITRFYQEDFDYRNTLLLEEDPKMVKTEKPSPQNDAKILSYAPTEVVIAVKTDTPALLFLSDNYYPKWEVLVNGKKEKIYRADYTLRAVMIPKGESKVTFTFEELF